MRDSDGHRRFNIDGRNMLIPTSIFVVGEGGYCIELDKAAFIDEICREFGLTMAEVSIKV